MPDRPKDVDPVALAALYGQQAGRMDNLWAVYVVATFAAAGFGSSADLTWPVALAVTVGFWTFALGHLSLLRQALVVLEGIRLDLGRLGVIPTVGKAAHEAERDGVAAGPLAETRASIAGISDPVWLAVAVQLIIDLCVTAAIWLPVLLGPGPAWRIVLRSL